MTKVRFVGPIGGFSGAMDGMVFADHGERTVAYLKKNKKDREPSEAEQERDDRWAEARAYARSAMADPEKWELYKLVGKEKKLSPFILAMNDYRNAPSFRSLDLQLYRGRVGDPIQIRAIDDVGLVSVSVELISPAGTHIEKGMAVENGVRTGFWTYTATQAVSPGTDLFIEVTGVDHTGHQVKMTENPAVGQN